MLRFKIVCFFEHRMDFVTLEQADFIVFISI